MSERCHFCGGPMEWDSDATLEDVEGGPTQGIVSFYHCRQCGATAQWTKTEEANQ